MDGGESSEDEGADVEGDDEEGEEEGGEEADGEQAAPVRAVFLVYRYGRFLGNQT